MLEFSIVRYLNKFFLFSSSTKGLYKLESSVNRYFGLRNLRVTKKNVMQENLFSGFNFLKWDFFKTRNGLLLGRISLTCIRYHKLKLKSILKKSDNLNMFSFLELMNKEILAWKQSIASFGEDTDICYNLDVYLYRLLWKWAIRRHPRRPRVWIYSKYWKFVNGRWLFFVLDYKLGFISFLQSHFFTKLFIYSFPVFTNVFDFNDKIELHSLIFNKLSNSYSGLFKFLLKRQNGICICCGKSFYPLNPSSLKILNDFPILMGKNIVLLHNYCG